MEHCSIVCCLFGHVLLIVIDLIFCRTIASLPLCCRIIASLPRCCKNHREPSTVLQNYRETSTVLQEPSQAFQNQHNNASLPADYCKLKQYLCMLILSVACCTCTRTCMLFQLLDRLFTLWPLIFNIGVALFVESGRFLLLCLSTCGPFLTVRCVGNAA